MTGNTHTVLVPWFLTTYSLLMSVLKIMNKIRVIIAKVHDDEMCSLIIHNMASITHKV